ncbi:MAG: hypothetical protein B7Z66_10270 [Chromatiales bacterium 21-64-14]|nr:MAG: hypothetical protein B7Z66_10270 [Chromatiales bacterium 21-64-14]HQU16397.1 hypothetical protein [Gammaproteobacteria bacterium]
MIPDNPKITLRHAGTWTARVFVGLSGLALAIGAVAGPSAEPIEVIPLHYRTAAEVLPLLRPFLASTGTLAGDGYRLIVRTTPENLHELTALLRKIDAQPRLLRITVEQESSTTGSRSDVEINSGGGTDRYRVTAPPQIGDHAGGGTIDNGLRARVYRTEPGSGREDTQQIQVLEGRPAYIDLGRSVPVADSSLVVGGPQPQVLNTLRYRDLTVGFQVVARTAGQQVILKIQPQRATLSPRGGGEIDVQRAQTTVTGTLGKWIELGGAARHSDSSATGVVYQTREFDQDLRRIRVKVELARSSSRDTAGSEPP